MIAAAAQMIQPTTLNSRCIQQTLAAKTRFGKKVSGPRAQGAFQPRADRHVETLFRSIDQVARQVAAENLPQDPFSLATTHLRGVR
jgi:hypothetical protein